MSISNFVSRLLITICILFSASAYAFELNGAWTVDSNNCGKVFVKNNNKITFGKDADVNGGGFIFEGNQIRGNAMTCKIGSRKEEGALLRLTAECTTGVAYSTMHLSVKMDDANKITRVFPDSPAMNMSYVRCAL